MKKLVLLFILFSLHSVKAQENNSIIGKWVDADKKTSVVDFFENKTANLSMMGKVIPINEYKTDNSKNPIWVDFTIKIGSQSITLFGLAEFIDANTIKWEVFPMGAERQTAFTGKNSILKKQ